MIGKNHRVLIYLLLSILSSCGILSDDDEYSISKIDSQIQFKVVESYEKYDVPSIPQIFIELQTEKIYGCSNYSMKLDYVKIGNLILIDIQGIIEWDVCLTSLGPAQQRIKLGRIFGDYEIKIKISGYTDKYNLSISDSLILLKGNETTHSKPLSNNLWRYPENSFAYLSGTLLADSALCGKFIDTLKTVISLTEIKFSPTAEIPYPSSSQGHYYDADARYFRYENEEDFVIIEEVLQSFKHDYFPDDYGTGFSVINWMNKKIHSWLL